MNIRTFFFIALSFSTAILSAQEINKFEQLGTLLPTPNETRSASGVSTNF